MADKTIGIPAASGLVGEIEAYRYKNKLGSTAEAARALMQKALEREERMKGKVETEDNSAMTPIAQTTKARFMQLWVEHSYKNYPLVEDDMQPDQPLGGALLDIQDKHKGEPCIITGSGPSFDYSVGFLKDWKGLILCGPTQIQTLLHHGVKPRYIVAYDAWPDFEKYMQIDRVPQEDYEGITLLTTPNIDPWLTHKWAERGYPRKWFMTFTSHRQKHHPLAPFPLYTVKGFLDDLHPEAEHPLSRYVYDDFQNFFCYTMVRAFGGGNPTMARRNIKVEGVNPLLINTGSTPNQSVLVANCLGCYPIFMFGNDLCYAEDGRQRAITYHLDKEGKRVPMEMEKDSRDTMISDTGRPTRNEFIVYKNALLTVLTQDMLRNQQVWECAKEGEWGIMDLLPRITPEKLMETQGYGLEREDPTEKENKIRTYIKSHFQSGDPDANQAVQLPSS